MSAMHGFTLSRSLFMLLQTTMLPILRVILEIGSLVA